MKKMLMLASVASMIDQFNIPNIEILQQQGYEVHVACNFEKGSTCSAERISELKKKLASMNATCFQIDFSRNVFKVNEVIKAYKQVKELCVCEKYQFIHCHSPIGGVIGRMVGHAMHIKVIYTAHGFHFFKGAPFTNWLIYYPIEKWLSRYTDILITINQEDYERAKKRFKAKRVFKIPGIGLNTKNIFDKKVDRNEIRKQIQVPQEAFMIISVGELNTNKNQEVIIKALKEIRDKDIYYVLCGIGSKKEYLEKLCRELGIEDNVKFLGFRNDVIDLCKAADVFAFPSLREGLGMAALEGMATGLPLITSNIHGINDYSIDGISGYKCSRRNVKDYVRAIRNIKANEKLKEQMKENNLFIVKKFDSSKTNGIMKKIYLEI